MEEAQSRNVLLLLFFCCHSTERLQKESRGHRCSNRRHTPKLLPQPPFEFEKARPLASPTPNPALTPPPPRKDTFLLLGIPAKGGRGRTLVRSRNSSRGGTGGGQGGVQCELAWGGSGGLGGSCHVTVIPGRGFQSCFLCAFSGTV